ncbi:MAG: protease complex subunit PrcB family protein [Marinobacter sp.]
MKLRYPRVGFVVSVLLFAGCAATVSRSETSEGAPLARQVTQSDHCGLTAPGVVYVERYDQLQRLSRLPAQNLALDSLVSVDFEREHLVLVGLGQKPTGGYGVTLESSAITEGVLELSVNVRQPSADTMVTQALTTPCAVIAVTSQAWDRLRVSGTGMETITRRR